MGATQVVRHGVRVCVLALVVIVLAAFPGRAQADEEGNPELPSPFSSEACLQSQVAAQWSPWPPPFTFENNVEWSSNLVIDRAHDLSFTAQDTEVKVAAPGVLANDHINLGELMTVPEWNDSHGSTQHINAELVHPPAHAASFTLHTDGSFEWYPEDGWSGGDSFDYVAELNGNCGPPVTVTISATFRTYAVDDSFVSYGDGPLDATFLGVMDNDKCGLPSCAPVPDRFGSLGEVGSVTYAAADGNRTTDVLDPVRLEHGVLHMLPRGTFTFQPDPGFRGTQDFWYTPVAAGPPSSAGGPRLGKVSLVINDALPIANPYGVDDPVTTAEDTSINLSPSVLMANDNQARFMTAVGQKLGTPSTFRTWHGTLAITWGFEAGLYQNARTITYTPDPDFHGVDFFDYWVAANLPLDTNFANPGRVLIDVTPVVEAPVAVDDTATTLENKPVVVPVRANDSDDESLAQTDIWLGPNCGCATYTFDNVKGTVTVTPDPGLVGEVRFSYALHDSDDQLSNNAFVRVTVNRDDAVDDAYTTPEDTTLVKTAPGVRVNDENGAGFLDVLELVGSPQHGTVDLDADGSFSYVPAADYTGADSFTYAYRNPTTGRGDIGTVRLDVTPVNDAPVVALNAACQAGGQCLVGEVRDVDEGGTVTMNGYVTDEELNQGNLTVHWGDGSTTTSPYPCVGSGCAFSTVPTFSPPAFCIDPPTGPPVCPVKLFFRFTHKYADDRAGTDDRYPIDVTADDGRAGATSTSAWVRNVAPEITLLSNAEVQAQEGQPVAISAKVADPGDSAPLVVDWGDGSAPEQATISCSVNFTNCTFGAQHTYAKRATPYTATLSADDGDGGTDSETVTVSFSQPPVAQDVEASVDEDDVLSVVAPGLLGSASDADGDTVTLTSHTDPSHGELEVSAGGAWAYTPDANYHGPDSFTYTVAAGGQEDTGTVSITVNPVNDPPSAPDDSATTAEETPVVVTPAAADADGDALTLAVASGPASGSVTVTASGLRYVPDLDFNGTDSFTYTASDGPATSAPGTVTVTVTGVNDPPTAADVELTTTEDTAVSTAGDVGDVDGDDLTLSVVDDPEHGTVALVAGKLQYTPDADYSGEDSFTYRASDGSAQSSPATVAVTVTEVADVPVVGAIADVSAVYSDAITPFTVSATDEDSAPAALSFSASGLPAGLTLTSAGNGTAGIAGTVTAAPGSYAVTVRACDQDAQCGTASFNVRIAAETATVRLAPNNPFAVAIGRSGAPAVTVTARITDAADGSYGDLARVTAAAVRVAVTPTGGGSATTCPASVTKRVAATATTPGYAEVSCTFAAGLGVDVYDVTVEVSGSFTGTDASLLSVYDPQARGATGAGVVLLANGNSAQFAFSAEADGKKVKGKVALLERNASGDIVNVVKGVNLSALVITSGSPKTAKITGKAVVNGAGNYSFVLTGTDLGTSSSTPSAPDTLALQLTAPGGAPAVPSMTFAARGVAAGGNINIR
jgi:hypothetical protein